MRDVPCVKSALQSPELHKEHQEGPYLAFPLSARRATGLLAGLGLLVAACGGAANVPTGSTTTTSPAPPVAGGSTAAGPTAAAGARTLACTSGADLVGVVVQAVAGTGLGRCVKAPAGGISAVAALSAAHIQTGTQRYSFGLAICQVDNVPAHYVSCLPSGKPYWALFVSHAGAAWVAASTGVSGVTLKPGDSVGLRYDSPAGAAQPPAVPPPLR